MDYPLPWSKVKLLSCVQLFATIMGCSLPGSLVHRFFQTSVPEWVAISYSRRSSQPRNQTWVSCIAGGFFTNWAIREAKNTHTVVPKGEERGKMSTGLSPVSTAAGINEWNKRPFHYPASGAPYLLIGELLCPNKQVDSREACASAKEGYLHALVRIPKTEQHKSGGFCQTVSR